MPRIIQVIISPKGATTIQTKGYAGSDCQQASKWLEYALGNVTSEQKTAEFYETVQTPQQQAHQ
jgi:Protein of unknown function (DUF2997)